MLWSTTFVNHGGQQQSLPLVSQCDLEFANRHARIQKEVLTEDRPEISDNTTIIRFQVLNLAVDAAATADGIQVPQIQILGGAAAQFIQARAAPVITNTVAESGKSTCFHFNPNGF